MFCEFRISKWWSVAFCLTLAVVAMVQYWSYCALHWMLYMSDIAILMQCAYDAWHSSRFRKCCLEAEHDYWIKLINLCTVYSVHASANSYRWLHNIQYMHSLTLDPFKSIEYLLVIHCVDLNIVNSKNSEHFNFEIQFSIDCIFNLYLRLLPLLLLLLFTGPRPHKFRILNWEIFNNEGKLANGNRTFPFVWRFLILEFY